MISKLNFDEENIFYNEDDPSYSIIKYIGYQPMTHTISSIKIGKKCNKNYLCYHTVLYTLKDGSLRKERDVCSVKIKKLYQDLMLSVPTHFKDAEYTNWITFTYVGKHVEHGDSDSDEDNEPCSCGCSLQ